jgi:hypothetical protein
MIVDVEQLRQLHEAGIEVYPPPENGGAPSSQPLDVSELIADLQAMQTTLEPGATIL